MSIFEQFGWFGAICFALCTIPQAWLSFRQKHSDGVSWGFLNLWLGGEIGMITYILGTQLDSIQLLTNYFCNLVGLLIIIWFKLFPSR